MGLSHAGDCSVASIERLFLLGPIPGYTSVRCAAMEGHQVQGGTSAAHEVMVMVMPGPSRCGNPAAASGHVCMWLPIVIYITGWKPELVSYCVAFI
jgi:hypothetical protein